MIFSTRTLGFVNAPALFQRILPESLEAVVEVDAYKKRRDLLYDIITKTGFKCLKPYGAFYLFPQSPIADDVEFCKAAVKHNLVNVPGKGFGCPGYFRLAYCVDEITITFPQEKTYWISYDLKDYYLKSFAQYQSVV